MLDSVIDANYYQYVMQVFVDIAPGLGHPLTSLKPDWPGGMRKVIV